MKINNNLKILNTPHPHQYHLYIPNGRKHILIGEKEKIWINKLRDKEFTLSDIQEVVGNSYYLKFYQALVNTNIIDNKTKKKLNIFKLQFNFNLTLSNALKFQKFNKAFENVIFLFLPINIPIIFLFCYIYHNLIIQQVTELRVNYQNVIYWIIIVLFSAIIHELSHAITAKNYKVNIPNCGIMFLLFNFAFFVDLSGIKFLKKEQHFLRVMLSGIASNSILSILGIILLIFTQAKVIGLLLFSINLGMIVVNALPFFDYDGGILYKNLVENKNDKTNMIFQYIIQFILAFLIIYFANKFIFSLIVIPKHLYSPISFLVPFILSILYIKRSINDVIPK